MPDPFRDGNLIPCWMTERMMQDTWTFGLLLSTGITIVIERIVELHQAADDSLWIDVELNATAHLGDIDIPGPLLKQSPTDRNKATINPAHVVAAFELVDT